VLLPAPAEFGPNKAAASCAAGPRLAVTRGSELPVSPPEPAELPNNPATCCNWSACVLNWTRSAGDAIASADCTELEDSAAGTGDDALAAENVCSRSATPGFTELTEDIAQHIGRNRESLSRDSTIKDFVAGLNLPRKYTDKNT
jgi:hypothetical protein